MNPFTYAGFCATIFAIAGIVLVLASNRIDQAQGANTVYRFPQRMDVVNFNSGDPRKRHVLIRYEFHDGLVCVRRDTDSISPVSCLYRPY